MQTSLDLLPAGGDSMVIGLSINCAREACGKELIKVTHNQKYCSNECCRIETNRKIMEEYHKNVAILRGQKRECVSCLTSLSRYNKKDICAACEKQKKAETISQAQKLIASVSWL